MRNDPELKSAIAEGLEIKPEEVMNPSAKIDGEF